MVSDQSFYDQNSFVNITVLLVDDDPTVLSIVSTMLKTSKYKDSSIMEIRVTTVKNSLEALSTLRVQRDNIDLVITDYHMPGMNGIELTKIIDQEFGKLPVVVMSSDSNNEIEKETISNGGLCFITKPVKPKDVSTIWHYALRSKKNAKSISTDPCGNNDEDKEDNKDEDDKNKNNAMVTRSCKDMVVSINGGDDDDRDNKKTWTRRPYTGSASQEANNKVDEINVNGNGLGDEKRRRRDDNFDENEDEDDSRPSAPKKAKVVWTNSLHNLFLQAIRHIGLDKAVPKKILEFMSVPGLTRENIASHLQKYRIFLKKVAERGAMQSGLHSNRSMNSNFAYGHFNSSQPYFSHTVPYGSSLSHRPYNSELGFGLGQTRLLMNNNSSSSSSSIGQISSLYSNMNRSSYGANRVGSASLLPNRGSLAFYNASSTLQTPSFPRQNEERRDLLHMGKNPGRIGQTSQFQGIGSSQPYGTSNSSGLNQTQNPRKYSGSTAYAGIRMNDRGELIGLGPLQGNGNVANANNSLSRGVGYINWGLNNNNLNGNGSSSTTRNHNHGFGHLSAHQPSSSSSSQSPSPSSSPASRLFSQMQPFLSNANKGQSQGNAANGQVDFAFPELEKAGSILSCQNHLSGEHVRLPELPYYASNFQFDHNQMQGEVSSQNLEHEETPFGMGNLLDAITVGNTKGWNSENASQHVPTGDILNSAATGTSASASDLEMYSPTIDNHPIQEQGAADLMELSCFNQDWNDDFMDSLFDYGMH